MGSVSRRIRRDSGGRLPASQRADSRHVAECLADGDWTVGLVVLERLDGGARLIAIGDGDHAALAARVPLLARAVERGEMEAE